MINEPIIFKNIKFKNIMSYGDKFTELNLQDTDNVLISGKNGHGKSTILSCIMFALYGKPYTKIKKDELVNRINGKGLSVEIEFNIGLNEYKVIRSIKPGKFEIYRNDDLMPQSSTTREYQILLEQTIIKMSETTFRQTVILGSADYTPFLRMSLSDRRLIIEELIDIKMFTHMNKVTKGRVSEAKNKLKDIQHNISIAETDIKHISEYISDYENNKSLIIEGYLAEETAAKNTIVELETELDELNMKLSEYSDFTGESELADIESEIQGYKDIATEHNTLNKSHKKNIEFYENNDKCPTCKDTIDIKFKKVLLTEAHDNVKTNNKIIDTQSNGAMKMMNKLSSLKATIKIYNELIADIKDVTRDINQIKSTLTNLEQKIVDQKSKSVTSKVKELKLAKTSLRNADKEETEIETFISEHTIILSLLKDDGVKATIIKNYLPVFNSIIQKYIDLMGFNIRFSVDEQFNDIIHMGRDQIAYLTMSEGQKKRVDLAMVWAIRDLASVKNSINTNLLIMDEIADSSLDTTGIDALMTIINSMKGTGQNIVVISHRPELADRFDKHMTATMTDKFSKLI